MFKKFKFLKKLFSVKTLAKSKYGCENVSKHPQKSFKRVPTSLAHVHAERQHLCPEQYDTLFHVLKTNPTNTQTSSKWPHSHDKSIGTTFITIQQFHLSLSPFVAVVVFFASVSRHMLFYNFQKEPAIREVLHSNLQSLLHRSVESAISLLVSTFVQSHCCSNTVLYICVYITEHCETHCWEPKLLN